MHLSKTTASIALVVAGFVSAATSAQESALTIDFPYDLFLVGEDPNDNVVAVDWDMMIVARPRGSSMAGSEVLDLLQKPGTRPYSPIHYYECNRGVCDNELPRNLPKLNSYLDDAPPSGYRFSPPRDEPVAVDTPFYDPAIYRIVEVIDRGRPQDQTTSRSSADTNPQPTDQGIHSENEGMQPEGDGSPDVSTSGSFLDDTNQGGDRTESVAIGGGGPAPEPTEGMRNVAPDEPTLADGQAVRGL